MSWFQKILPPKIKRRIESKKSVPEGLWSKCPACNEVLYRADLESNLEVCPKCGHHHRIGARHRLAMLLDAEGQHEIGANITSLDPLKFKDSKKYPDRLKEAQGQHIRDRRAGGDGRQRQGYAGGGGGVRVQVHGRLDGLGGGRAFRAGRGGGDRIEVGLQSAFPQAAARACRKACFR